MIADDTERSYYGLCIDGPNAGKFLSWNSPTYTMAILTDGPPTQPQRYKDKRPENVRTFHYTHIIGIHIPDMMRSIDFWVPSGQNTTWAINRLLGCYQSHARKETR